MINSQKDWREFRMEILSGMEGRDNDYNMEDKEGFALNNRASYILIQKTKNIKKIIFWPNQFWGRGGTLFLYNL